MKVLTVKQPWAHFIVTGQKDIENRSWSTSHRGPLLIHAGKRFDDSAVLPIGFQMPQDLLLGGIVGIVNICACVRNSKSPWFIGPVGWVLDDARELPFLAMPGKQGLFEVNDIVLSRLGLKRPHRSAALFD